MESRSAYASGLLLQPRYRGRRCASSRGRRSCHHSAVGTQPNRPHRSIVARVSVDRNVLSAALGVPLQALDGVAFSWPGFDSPPDRQVLSPAEIQQLALLNRIDLRRQLAQYAASDEALK